MSWDASRQKLHVNKDLNEVQTAFRHGYLKGMSPAIRQDFNHLMDLVDKTEGVEAKITLLQDKIQSFEKKSDKSALVFLQYIRAELAHLMHLSGYQPRSYVIDVARVP